MNKKKFRKANSGWFSLHQVPRDTCRLNEWQNALHNIELVHGKSFVCSQHFHESHYNIVMEDKNGNVTEKILNKDG